MLTRIRQRLRADDGLTVVEMLVAMLLLGVVLSAAASSLISSFVAMNGAESRTRATALANEELENLRALPYDRVGYRNGQTPPAGLTSPVLLPVLPGNPQPPTAVEDRTVGGTTFRVTRSIEWVDNISTSSSEDYKRLRVLITWNDRGATPRSVSVESIRAPEAPEEGLGSPFVLSLFDVQPEVVHLNADGSIRTSPVQTPTPLSLSARTSAPAEFVDVSFRQSGDSTDTVRNLANSGDGVNWMATTGGITMENGEALLTFRAKRLSPFTDVVLGQRIVRFLYPQAFRGVVVTPHGGSFCLAPDAPTPDVVFDVDVDGMVAEDSLRAGWGTGNAVDGTVTGTNATGTQYRMVVPAGTYADAETVTLTATRLGTESVTTTHAISVQRDPAC